MKLPEFITYCKLKDLIVLHERLDNEWHADKVNKQRLIIENDNYLAIITYTHFAGEYNILESRLYRVLKTEDVEIDHDDLGDIISKIA